MVEWKGIFRLFRFSGILGQPREVLPKFQNEIPGFPEFLVERKAPLVGPLIKKKPCRSRQPISDAERLMLTLRFLATGDSQQSHSFSFRIGRAKVSNILREIMGTIWHALNKKYLSPPTEKHDWIRIVEEFETEWNFPHCIGAIDTKARKHGMP